jgi:glutathione S-transferase
MGTVPFLEDDGVGINESIAMLLYIAQKYGPTPLLPSPQDKSFARVLQMTVFGEATLGAYGNVQMGARFFAPDEQKANWSVDDARTRMQRGYDYAAQLLGAGPWFAGELFTLADISVGYTVPFAAMLGMEAPKALADHHARCTARPAYQRASAVQ